MAAIGPDNAWAAGDFSLVEHYDSTQWTAKQDKFGFTRAMSASSRSDIWAVTDASRTRHFDGRHWTLVDSPSLGRLDGVSTVGPQLAVAVSGPDAEAFDGSAWSQVPTAGIGSLYAVSLDSASNGWAVGADGRNPLIEHWDGTDFTAVP